MANMFLNDIEINNIKNKITSGQQPWKDAYDK